MKKKTELTRKSILKRIRMNIIQKRKKISLFSLNPLALLCRPITTVECRNSMAKNLISPHHFTVG